jgi:hypothetical protein
LTYVQYYASVYREKQKTEMNTPLETQAPPPVDFEQTGASLAPEGEAGFAQIEDMTGAGPVVAEALQSNIYSRPGWRDTLGPDEKNEVSQWLGSIFADESTGRQLTEELAAAAEIELAEGQNPKLLMAQALIALGRDSRSPNPNVSQPARNTLSWLKAEGERRRPHTEPTGKPTEPHVVDGTSRFSRVLAVHQTLERHREELVQLYGEDAVADAQRGASNLIDDTVEGSITDPNGTVEFTPVMQAALRLEALWNPRPGSRAAAQLALWGAGVESPVGQQSTTTQREASS